MTDSGSFLTAWEDRPLSRWETAWRVPELHVFARVGSTNDIVKARAEQGAPAGTLAIAELQSKGRGRRERSWHAPNGTALLLSMLFRPAVQSPADLAGTIPLRVGMAVARAIEHATGLQIALKWPNDVLSRDGRKVAGILCESSLAGQGVAYTVVGIGVNVLQTDQQLHRDDRNEGVSLRTLLGSAPDRGAIATAVIAELLPLAQMAAAALTPSEMEEYAQRDILAHHEVTADGAAVGVVAGIGAHGDLRVRDDKGVRSIHAGTIRKAE